MPRGDGTCRGFSLTSVSGRWLSDKTRDQPGPHGNGDDEDATEQPGRDDGGCASGPLFHASNPCQG